MSHGQPDYGMYSKAETIYRLSDMGELAVRLGSIDTFDRRGDVIFLSGFENGIIGFATTGSGAGYAIAQSSDTARNGGYSVKLTTGSDTNKLAAIYRDFPYPKLSSLGVEVSFTMDQSIQYFGMYVQIFDGSYYHSGHIRYDEDNTTLKYLDEDGNYQNLTTDLELRSSIYMFHTLKLVVDYENDNFKRLLLDSEEYSLADVPLRVAVSTDAPYTRVYIYAYGVAGSNVDLYIDDLIVTQNEP